MTKPEPFRVSKAIVVAATWTAASLISAELCAQERERAEATFREGRALLKQANVAAACDKFAESQKLDPSGGTLMNLAACHETQGKTATAWTEFTTAEQIATSEGKASRAAEARRRAAVLRQRLSYLTIVVPHAVPSLEIRLGGELVASSQLGVAVPVDPGLHRITASAPGYESATVDVTLGARADSQTLSLPELVAASSPLPPPEPTTPVDPDPTPTLPAAAPERPSPVAPLPPDTVDDSSAPPTLGWILGGAGIALLGTGGVFYALSLAENEEAVNGCRYQSRYACSESAIEAGDRRDRFATVATVSGLVGVTALGAGAWLLLSPPSRPSTFSGSVPAPRIVPAVTPRAGSLLLYGSFQ